MFCRNFCLLFLFLTAIVCSQTWELKHPKPSNMHIYDSSFLDSVTVFVVGNSGVIAKSTDRGKTFTNLESGYDETLKSILFIDSVTGYICGNSGLLLKTEDGGENWEKEEFFNEENLEKIYFNEGVIYLTGGKGTIATKSLEQNEWQDHSLSNCPNSINAAYFCNDYWLISGGFMDGIYHNILRSEDKGLTWSQLYISGGEGAPGVRESVGSIQKLENGNLILGGGCSAAGGCFTIGYIFLSEDDGKNWSEIFLYPSDNDTFGNAVADMVFLDSLTGIAVTKDPPSPGYHKFFSETKKKSKNWGEFYIVKTTDGGHTWERKYEGTDNFLSVTISKDKQTFIATDRDGGIYRSTDLGETWQAQDQYGIGWFNLFETIAFRNELEGFACGYGICKTEDGGETWQQLDSLQGISNGTYSLEELNFASENIGWTIDFLYLYRSLDGGSTWTKMNIDNDGKFHLKQYQILSANIVIAYNGKKIYKTTNCGESWELVHEVAESEGINKIHFINENKAWAIFNHHRVMFTSDGGSSWSQIYHSNEHYLNDIYFDLKTGERGILATNSYILYSEDGGHTWNNADCPRSTVYDNIKFVNSEIGFVNGYGFFLCKTTDGGKTWGSINCPYIGYSPAGICYANNKLWAVVNNTIAASTNFGGVGIEEEEQEQNLPKTAKLFQNYPNPFNPSTTISYNLVKPSNAQIKVFNILGQQIWESSAKMQKAGTHSLVFDASRFGSNIYFYRLEVAGETKDTKKMIFLK